MSGSGSTVAADALRRLQPRTSADDAGPGVPSRRPRTELPLTVAAVLAFSLWLSLDLATPDTKAEVSYLVFVLAPLFAARSCRRAHQARLGRHTGWWWLMVGCLVWATGSVVYAAYAVVGRAAPFPSLADVAYIGYAVPVIIGISRFTLAPSNPWSRWRLVLDAAVVAGCLLLISALFVLQPVLDATGATLTRWDAVAYPIADVTVASVVLARSLILPVSRRRVQLMLGAGLLVLGLTDSIYVARTFTGGFQPGGPLDVGWLLSFGLIAQAARDPAGVRIAALPVNEHEPPTLSQHLLPYLAILAALLCFVVDIVTVGFSPQSLWVALPLLVVVAVRQLVVVVDHVALARGLSEQVGLRTTELRSREQWWREILQNLTDVVIVVDPDFQVRYCSPSLSTVLGHLSDAPSSHELRDLVHPEDVAVLRSEMLPVVTGARPQGFAEVRVRTSGGWGWFEVSAVGQLSEQVLQGTVVTLHDVSERRMLTDRLAHQASHDALTDLPNRALLLQRVESLLSSSAERAFALVLVDLDDFKVINDRHGHASGDAVLEVIGSRLSGLAHAGDLVARLGGDEFAMVVSGTAEHVRSVTARMSREIAQPVLVVGRSFTVRASFGVVLPTDDEHESAHSMLSHADVALYEAKARDKGGIVVIDGPQRAVAAKQVHLREQIAQPDLDQFFLVYQPLVDLRTGTIEGVEALLRWQHPDLGFVPPDQFIPMAEHGGSIATLGWHVLRQGLAQLAAWVEQFPRAPLTLGVNVSIRQLEGPGFAQAVLDLVADHGLSPSRIVLELTEQSIALDFETAVSVVAELRAGGVSVAVDDYGTGYSSLQYLHRFAADTVKIDRSFIWNLEESRHTQKIVANVVDMAESLELHSVAEGIETREQLALVCALGCRIGQGYLFSRPVAAEQISEILRLGRPLVVGWEPWDAEPVS